MHDRRFLSGMPDAEICIHSAVPSCFPLQILAVDHMHAPIADNAILACVEFFTCGILFPDPDVFTGTATDAPEFSRRMAADPAMQAILQSVWPTHCSFLHSAGLPASTASLLMSTESVFSLLAGFLILHQMLNGREVCPDAYCCLWPAIILVQIKGKEKESIKSVKNIIENEDRGHPDRYP